jgi:hypothetical protein
MSRAATLLITASKATTAIHILIAAPVWDLLFKYCYGAEDTMDVECVKKKRKKRKECF